MLLKATLAAATVSTTRLSSRFGTKYTHIAEPVTKFVPVTGS